MGFTISAKNCSFQNTIDDLTTKASRAIFALKKKMKLNQLSPKLAIKIFQAQIAPILLYGLEIWAPYMNYDFDTWDKGKTERIQTQFLKQVLGCNFHTTNNMVSGDTGTRPLVNAILKCYMSYIKTLQTKKIDLCYDSYVYELQNFELPNFSIFTENFGLNVEDLIGKSKREINEICNGNHDRFWVRKLSESTKATSFIRFKTNISIETHLTLNFNTVHKKAISRFRLSNHPLMIEKGRHLKIDRNERKCYFCKDDIEDEKHFLIKCPLFYKQKKPLEEVCIETVRDTNNYLMSKGSYYS